MVILITGATGLIASRLAGYLHLKGFKLRLGSRSGSVPYELSNTEVVVTDWLDDKTLLSACNGVDVVIHAAGMNASDSAHNPLDAIIVNGVGTARLALAAVKSKVRKIIYLSTAHIYSDPLSGRISEECFANNIHPYASSHLAGEFAVRQVARNSEIQVLALRLSNAFGAPLSHHSNCWMLLVNDLCKQIAVTKKIKLNTAGMQWRDFIPISNLCNIFEKLIESKFDFNNFGVINVGGRAMQVIEMAELIQIRAEIYFKEKIIIERPEKIQNTQVKKLDYCCDRLINLIGPLQLDFMGEIDTLLEFCNINYSPIMKKI